MTSRPPNRRKLKHQTTVPLVLPLQKPPLLNEHSFQLDDLVLCRYSSYPYWPAFIHPTPQSGYQTKHFCMHQTSGGDLVPASWCNFINEDAAGWVRADRIVLFHPDLLKFARVHRQDRWRKAQNDAIARALVRFDYEFEETDVPQAPTPPRDLLRKSRQSGPDDLVSDNSEEEQNISDHSQPLSEDPFAHLDDENILIDDLNGNDNLHDHIDLGIGMFEEDNPIPKSTRRASITSAPTPRPAAKSASKKRKRTERATIHSTKAKQSKPVPHQLDHQSSTRRDDRPPPPPTSSAKQRPLQPASPKRSKPVSSGNVTQDPLRNQTPSTPHSAHSTRTTSKLPLPTSVPPQPLSKPIPPRWSTPSSSGNAGKNTLRSDAPSKSQSVQPATLNLTPSTSSALQRPSPNASLKSPNPAKPGKVAQESSRNDAAPKSHSPQNTTFKRSLPTSAAPKARFQPTSSRLSAPAQPGNVAKVPPSPSSAVQRLSAHTLPQLSTQSQSGNGAQDLIQNEAPSTSDSAQVAALKLQLAEMRRNNESLTLSLQLKETELSRALGKNHDASPTSVKTGIIALKQGPGQDATRADSIRVIAIRELFARLDAVAERANDKRRLLMEEDKQIRQNYARLVTEVSQAQAHVLRHQNKLTEWLEEQKRIGDQYAALLAGVSDAEANVVRLHSEVSAVKKEQDKIRHHYGVLLTDESDAKAAGVTRENGSQV